MIIIVAAYDEKRGIIKSKRKAYSLLSDSLPFRKLTYDKQILFGEKTQRKIGKPLTNRKTLILTEKINLATKGVDVVYDHMLVIKKYFNNRNEDIYICGGAKIYKLFIKYAEKLVIYHIKGSNKTLSKFPIWNISRYKVIKTFDHDIFIEKHYVLK